MKSVDTMMATPGKKRQMLQETLQRYHQALYWGDLDAMSLFFLPENRRDLYQHVRKNKGQSRIVKVDIEHVDTESVDGSAIVDILVSYIRTPAYVLMSSKERETWVFERFAGGWYLSELELIETEVPASAEVIYQ